ncbi:MAG: PGF-pre-PGF domain-containing protein [Halopenitus sp.]
MRFDSIRAEEARLHAVLTLLLAALVVGTPALLAGAAGAAATGGTSGAAAPASAAPAAAAALSVPGSPDATGTSIAASTSTADSPPIMAFRTADTGNVAMYLRDGTVIDFGVSSAVVGPLYDIDGDGLLEAIYVDGNGGINHVDRQGETGSLAADSAPTSKTMLAVGDRNGDGTPEVYYVNTNDNNYVYKVEPGGQPERVTATAAKAVLGIADFDGEGDKDLVFAGGSSTIKYYDGDVHSTGYSSIGSNNGYGAGAPADFDGDGVASVPIVDGSNNPALVSADGSKRAYKSGSAAKAPIAGVDVTGDGALDLVYVNKNGKVAYTTLDDSTNTVADADGNAIPATKKVGVVGASEAPPPTISDYAVTNPEQRNVSISFDSTRELADIQVTVTRDGETVATLTEADFAESSSGAGYTYTATYAATQDGTYTATLEYAADSTGKTADSTPEGSVAIDWRPTITDYTVSNPEARQIAVAFTSSEPLTDIAVDVAGPETVTLTEADFTESATTDGYRYRATTSVGTDGSYDATLTSAVDDAGYNGAGDETGSVTIETPDPRVVDASVVDPEDRDGVVGADDRIRVTATVEGENVTAVTAGLSAIGAGTVTLTHTGGDSYEATVAVDVDDTDAAVSGAYVFTVTARNAYNNTDSAGTDSLIVDTAEPVAETGPDITVEEGTKVVLDASGSRDNVGISRYVWRLSSGDRVAGEIVIRTFDVPGTHQITLTVVDVAGNRATATRTIVVENATSESGSASNDAETIRVLETVRIIDTDDSNVSITEVPTNSTRNSSGPGNSTETPDDATDTTNTTGSESTSEGVTQVVEFQQVPLDAIRFTEEPAAGYVRAEHLTAFPADVPKPPERVVHPLRIALSNDSDVSAILVFTVNRSEIGDAEPVDVTMLRYTDGSWEQLSTSVVERNADSLTFAAETDGFSYFAIAVSSEAVDSTPTDVPTGTVAGDTVATEQGTPPWLLLLPLMLLGICLVGYWGYREGYLDEAIAKAQDAVDQFQA